MGLLITTYGIFGLLMQAQRYLIAILYPWFMNILNLADYTFNKNGIPNSKPFPRPTLAHNSSFMQRQLTSNVECSSVAFFQFRLLNMTKVCLKLVITRKGPRIKSIEVFCKGKIALLPISHGIDVKCAQQTILSQKISNLRYILATCFLIVTVTFEATKR